MHGGVGRTDVVQEGNVAGPEGRGFPNEKVQIIEHGVHVSS